MAESATNQVQIVHAITTEIMTTAKRLKAEEYRPYHQNADDMDVFIKANRERLTLLRQIREQLEDEFAKP